MLLDHPEWVLYLQGAGIAIVFGVGAGDAIIEFHDWVAALVFVAGSIVGIIECFIARFVFSK